MVNTLKAMVRDENGQGMVEYGLLVALISVAVITALTSMKDELQKLFKAAVDGLKKGGAAAGKGG